MHTTHFWNNLHALSLKIAKANKLKNIWEQSKKTKSKQDIKNRLRSPIHEGNLSVVNDYIIFWKCKIQK